MINVLLVDDHEMVRLGVSSYLSMQDDIEVMDEAKNGREGVEKHLSLKPDIILMDLVMPEMDGIEATKEILEKWPEAKIIILTSFIDDEKVFPAINAGAKSYILKQLLLLKSQKLSGDTYNGDGVFEPQVTDKLVNRIQMKQQHFLHEDLTQRELEVLPFNRTRKIQPRNCRRVVYHIEDCEDARIEYSFKIRVRGQNASNDLCVQASTD